MKPKIYFTPKQNLEDFLTGEVDRIHVENLAYYLMNKRLKKEYENILYGNLEDLYYDSKILQTYFLNNRSDLTLYVLSLFFDILSKSYVKKEKTGASINFISAVLGRHTSTIRTLTNILEEEFVVGRFEHPIGRDLIAYSNKDVTGFKPLKAQIELFKTRFPLVFDNISRRISNTIYERIGVLRQLDIAEKSFEEVGSGELPITFYHIPKRNMDMAYKTFSPNLELMDSFPEYMNFFGLKCKLTKRRKRYLMLYEDGLWIVKVPLYNYPATNYVFEANIGKLSKQVIL